jgi:ribosomal-protein-alanine N-acetyltransferase
LSREEERGGSVRAAEAADVPSIASLERLVFDTEEGARRLAASLERGDGVEAWVAEDRTAVVGFVTARVLGEEVDVHDVAVHPGRRRRGVGTALLRGALRAWSDRGARRATLEVAASNEPALRLYRGLGFAVCGVRRGYYGGGREDAVVLQCDLERSRLARPG